MIDTLAETQSAAVDNACSDIYWMRGLRCVDLTDLVANGYLVIRVRIVEDTFAHAITAKALREAAKDFLNAGVTGPDLVMKWLEDRARRFEETR